MYRNILLATFALVIFTQGILKAADHPEKNRGKYPSAYLDKILVDGNLADWPSGMMRYDQKAMAWYAAANDSVCLYFCLRVAGRTGMMDLPGRGFTLWFDAEGRKKKTSMLGIIPVLPEGTFREIPPNVPRKMIPKQPPRCIPARIRSTGFKEGYNGEFPPDKPHGIAAQFGTDSTGMFSLEVCVPISALTENPAGTNILAIGFELAAQVEISGDNPPSEGGFRGSPGQGMHQPGGGQQGEGLMGQGGPGLGGPDVNRPGKGGPGEPPPGAPSPSGPQKIRIWHKCAIAPVR